MKSYDDVVQTAILREFKRQAELFYDYVGADRLPMVVLDGSFDIEKVAQAAIDALRLTDFPLMTSER